MDYLGVGKPAIAGEGRFRSLTELTECGDSITDHASLHMG